MRYMVLTSDGAVLETDSAEQYVGWLDEYGPEVVDQHEPTDAEQQRLTNRALMAQYGEPKPLSAERAAADEIDRLQTRYDRLERIRSRWIARYDAAPDGSRDKQVAIEQLDEIGRQVTAVEQQIETAIG